jgi:hypothetical protein
VNVSGGLRLITERVCTVSNCLKCEEYRLRFDRKAELQTAANWMLSLQLRNVLCGLRVWRQNVGFGVN